MHEPTQEKRPHTRPAKGMWYVQTVAALVAVWVLLSGRVDLTQFTDRLYLTLGVIGSMLIAASFYRWRGGVKFPFGRFLLFMPWHLWQVVISNLRVTKVALSPQRKIEPAFIERDPIVRSERAMTLLGCGVTLTPGTLTVEMEEGRYLVHSLDALSSADIEQDVMAKRVADVFGETAEAGRGGHDVGRGSGEGSQ